MAYLRNKNGRIKAKYYSKRFRKMIYKRFKSVVKYQRARRALRRMGLSLKRSR